MTDIGPHLLGRLPKKHDPRDYRLENFLGIAQYDTPATDADELMLSAQSHFKAATVTYKRWAVTVYKDPTTTHWWQGLAEIAAAHQILNPSPTPPPPPVNGAYWKDPEAVLDQGNEGTCVGFAQAQWGNSYPIDDKFVKSDARAIYYEATVLDGAPDSTYQQGATVRSGVQAMKNRGRLTTYAESTNLTTLEAWLKANGTITIGSDWTNDMFTPNSEGYIVPTGGIAGGHSYVWDEITVAGDYGFLNSWGSGWGVGGRFYMKKADFAKLLGNGGEAWTAVELPL